MKGKSGRLAGILVAAVMLSAVLAGCGGYYYRATIQGFVVDAETDAGINEATVSIYAEEIDDPDAAGYVARTSTVTQGGSDGYYSGTVVWRRLFGAYGQEGDTTTIWLAVEHPDYGSAVVAADGILSEEDNLIATIRLAQATFSRAAVRGRVVDSTGTGVNGVRVVLDLPVVAGTDDAEDYVTQTATVADVPGTYEFSPVEWSEANTTNANGEVAVVIRVDDPEWGADTGGIADPVTEDYIVEQIVTLVPGTQTRIVNDAFEVFRRPRTEFNATVTGRLVWLAGLDEEERPVQGVRVQLRYWRWTDGEPEPDPDVDDAFRTYVDFTDAQGGYVFAVSWTDLAPGDFDHADLRSDAVVSTEPGATDGIAAGEDGLVVGLSYADLQVPGGILAFSEESGRFQVYSNPRNGSNRLADLFKVPAAP